MASAVKSSREMNRFWEKRAKMEGGFQENETLEEDKINKIIIFMEGL